MDAIACRKSSCRICNYESANYVGIIHPYTDYSCQIYECPSCGCRFADYITDIYEQLHACPQSTYNSHDEIAKEIKQYFEKRDIKSIRIILKRNEQFGAIIDAVDRIGRNNPNAKILEVGSSRGYLTAYSILKGLKIFGCDIAHSANIAASSYFGNFFGPPDDEKIKELAPFDLIYHVGTIGCINKPIVFTGELIDKLAIGGKLVFNAPNKRNVDITQRLWTYETCPPDIVTLFNSKFWGNERFPNVTAVVREIQINPFDYYANRHKWKVPYSPKNSIYENVLHFKYLSPALSRGKIVRELMRQKLSGLLMPFFPRIPDPFGLIVTITKKSVVEISK